MKETSGHISSVKTFSHCISTGIMALHLSMKHIHEVTENKVGKIIDYIKKYEASSPFPVKLPASSHEPHRDFAIWFCRDLLPFETVGKERMIRLLSQSIPRCAAPFSYNNCKYGTKRCVHGCSCSGARIIERCVECERFTKKRIGPSTRFSDSLLPNMNISAKDRTSSSKIFYLSSWQTLKEHYDSITIHCFNFRELHHEINPVEFIMTTNYFWTTLVMSPGA